MTSTNGTYGALPVTGTASEFLGIVEQFGSVGYWVVDLIAQTVFWSAEVCKAHGEPDGYVPTSLNECIGRYHPEDRQRVSDTITQAMVDREPFTFEARLGREKTAIKWISVSGEVRCDDEGTPVAIFGALRDISRDRMMCNRLEQALHQARCANRLKDTFLANMSHELRTPLNAIIGFSQLIEMKHAQGAINDQVGEYATDISNAGAHLLAIIEDIFSLAELDAESGQVQLVPTPVEVVLDDVRALTSTLVRDSGQRIIFDSAPHHAACRINVDREKMGKTLVNLVSNAVKFSPDGSIIRLRSEIGADDRMYFSVVDKGPGIPEHLQEKIFERFERLEASKHAIEGIGVGLAIARDLAQSMGGEIGVTSEVGAGATFWLAFDLVEKVERALAG